LAPAVEAKIVGAKKQGFGLWKELINIHDSFDEPLSDFEEYM
jgi:hypothetical protein